MPRCPKQCPMVTSCVSCPCALAASDCQHASALRRSRHGDLGGGASDFFAGMEKRIWQQLKEEKCVLRPDAMLKKDEKGGKSYDIFAQNRQNNMVSTWFQLTRNSLLFNNKPSVVMELQVCGRPLDAALSHFPGARGHEGGHLELLPNPVG